MITVNIAGKPSSSTAQALLSATIAENVSAYMQVPREEVDIVFAPTPCDESASSPAYFTVHTVTTQPGRADAWREFRRTNVLPALSEVPGFIEAVLVEDQVDSSKHYVVTRWAERSAFDNYFHGQVEAALKPISETHLVARASEVLAGEIVRLLG